MSENSSNSFKQENHRKNTETPRFPRKTDISGKMVGDDRKNLRSYSLIQTAQNACMRITLPRVHENV